MNVLSLSPISYFVCDETGPFHIEFTDRHKRKVYMLLCLSVVTRKLYIMPKTVELDPEYHRNDKLPSLFNLLKDTQKAC